MQCMFCQFKNKMGQHIDEALLFPLYVVHTVIMRLSIKPDINLSKNPQNAYLTSEMI